MLAHTALAVILALCVLTEGSKHKKYDGDFLFEEDDWVRSSVVVMHVCI